MSPGKPSSRTFQMGQRQRWECSRAQGVYFVLSSRGSETLAPRPEVGRVHHRPALPIRPIRRQRLTSRPDLRVHHSLPPRLCVGTWAEGWVGSSAAWSLEVGILQADPVACGDGLGCVGAARFRIKRYFDTCVSDRVRERLSRAFLAVAGLGDHITLSEAVPVTFRGVGSWAAACVGAGKGRRWVAPVPPASLSPSRSPLHPHRPPTRIPTCASAHGS